ncbi:MAG: transcription termination factor Rho [Lachnospiraceae bacterium]|nr:transcription termination factor Rho [Lachnospiraceae bacterium]
MNYKAEDLSSLSSVELKNIAKELGIKNISAKRKTELVSLISEMSGGAKSEEKAVNKKAADKKAVDKKSVDKREAEKRAVNKKEVDKKPADKREADKKAVDKREATKKAADKKEAAKKAVDKKAADIKPGEKNDDIQKDGIPKSSVIKSGEIKNEAMEAKAGPGAPDKAEDKRINYKKSEVKREEMPADTYKREDEMNTYEQGTEEASRNENERHTTSDGQFVMNEFDTIKTGVLEIMPDGFGFLRNSNYLPGTDDVYVSVQTIKRLGLRNGDMIKGVSRVRGTEKYGALVYVQTVNGLTIAETLRRPKFENLTPIFPKERIHLETPGCPASMRMMDLLSPIGKGQRGMIVSQPKAGKTTLMKQVAGAIQKNHPEMYIIILLIDERPEEVTDMKESIKGDNVEVIYSTFDELPDHHKKVSEMVIEHAKRIVESKKDVIILLDSITRLARAYNLTVTPSGRTLSGGLDPAALYSPKRFFGAARKMREGGSLTILATALVETGSRMDDVVYEEFKGTGNMELVLNRNLSERRIFPAIDLAKSSTRRDDLLLTEEEAAVNLRIRRAVIGAKAEEAIEKVINLFSYTSSNEELIQKMKQQKPLN